MEKIIRNIGLGILILVTYSCSDFLNEEPYSNVNSENFYQTEDDLVAATNAIYDFLTVGTEGIFDEGFGGIFFNDWWVIKDILSDNCLETISSPDYQAISLFELNATNKRIELYWQDLYKTIFSANIVISRAPGIEMDEAKRNHLISEAKFIRAMMYFELVRLFGDAPLILKENKSIDDALVGRSPSEDIYQAIIEDLQFCEKNFLENYRYGKGRGTSIASTALLSKVYLEQGDYQSAVNASKEVIDSNKFFLWPDYKEIFLLKNMNQGEVIYAVNYSGSLSEGFKPNQYHVRLLPPNIRKDDEGPENAWGWEVPTENLYDEFEYFDRRRTTTFIESFEYSDGTTANFDPHIGKFWDQEEEPNGNNTDTDVIYLRYADVLLIYAEALNELNGGPTEQAYWAINQVRQRARFDGNVVHNILPDLSGLDYIGFRNALFEERRLEFVMEGQRYHDLNRQGNLVEAVNNSGKQGVNAQSYHNLLPIPQREIDLNPNLTQNPGY